MDTKTLKQVVAIFEKSQLSSMNLECEEMKIQMEKKDLAQTAVQQEEIVAEDEDFITLKSPLVGTFYASSASDQPPYVEVGQEVKKGDVLCILEAMKAMNEIKASQDGIIEEILVENGQMVEFDQVLMKMRDCNDTACVDCQ